MKGYSTMANIIKAIVIKETVAYDVKWKCPECNFENIHSVDELGMQKRVYCHKCDKRMTIMAERELVT